jgi:ElaB/YqjD/DUF883 family membrane-anchored ribosome-binding protein
MAPRKTKVLDAVGGVRDDIARLTGQVGSSLSEEARAQIGRIKETVDTIISNASEKGREATQAVRDMTSDLSDTAEESLRAHPFTALAVAVGLGFVLGAAWRRR